MSKCVDSYKLRYELASFYSMSNLDEQSMLRINELVDKCESDDFIKVVRCRDCVYRGKILCPMFRSYEREDFTVDNGYCDGGRAVE